MRGFPRTLGEHLRKRRFEAGLLQRELAEILGVNESTVINWERDRRRPQGRLWTRLIEFLGYDPPDCGEVTRSAGAHRATRIGLSVKGVSRCAKGSPRKKLPRHFER